MILCHTSYRSCSPRQVGERKSCSRKSRKE
jgi:hypothetical protein